MERFCIDYLIGKWSQWLSGFDDFDELVGLAFTPEPKKPNH